MCNESQENKSGGICEMIVALNPNDSNETRVKYQGWMVGLHMYACGVKHYFNNEYFEKDFDAEIDPIGFLNTNMAVATVTDEIYKPLMSRRNGVDESGETSEIGEEYHVVTEMALNSAFANHPVIVAFSDAISKLVPVEFNREYGKLKGDPENFVGIPVCFYFGNVDAFVKATNCTYCIAMLRTNWMSAIRDEPEEHQLILMYENEDAAKNDEYGHIHYIPFNSRSEIDKYLTMSGEADKILINLFIRFMNGELTSRGA